MPGRPRPLRALVRLRPGVAARLALISAWACGGPTRPAAPSAACRPAYAAYEAEWSSALKGDLEELHFEGNMDEVVVIETATLPRRDELVKLAATYKIIEAFVPDAAWPRAYAAAGAAIDVCGEGAARPR